MDFVSGLFLRSWKVEIFSTDIDTQVLSRSESGIYSQFEVQRGLPIKRLMKHFTQVEKGWQIKDGLRERIEWKQYNLLDDFSHFGPFDVVFCRNVLIYFDVPTKADILDRICKVTHPSGYLFLGSAETVLGICDRFERFRECNSAVYRPVAGVPA